MSDPRHARGIAAEEAVARWLAANGWAILARRCRSPSGGEVDIVALDRRRVLVAVEVRARRSRRAGRPAETVDYWRVARIERTLLQIASRQRAHHTGMRVDLVSAEPVDGFPGRWQLRRLPGIGEG